MQSARAVQKISARHLIKILLSKKVSKSLVSLSFFFSISLITACFWESRSSPLLNLKTFHRIRTNRIYFLFLYY